MCKAGEPRSKTTYSGKAELVAELDEINASTGHAHLRLMVALADADKAGIWINDGCRDMGEWVAARYGISRFKARKLVKTAHRLRELPAIRSALGSGQLSLDKTIELVRFATPEDEGRLLEWAKKVLPVTIRERADAANRPEIDKVKDADRNRYLRWDRGLDDSLLLEGCLPAYEGSLVIKAIDEVAGSLPASPEDPADARDAKRADALVALAEGKLSDGKGNAALVVIEASASSMASSDGEGARIEDGAVLHPAVLNRLACDSFYETQATDGEGGPYVGLGRKRRFPDDTTRRAIERRDHHRCTFPGCEAKSWLRAHHSLFWDRDDGPTDVYVMHMVCNTHHKLPHEFGWESRVGHDGVSWYRPDGSRYRPSPAPPEEHPPEPRSRSDEELRPILFASLLDERSRDAQPWVLAQYVSGELDALAVLRPDPHHAGSRN